MNVYSGSLPIQECSSIFGCIGGTIFNTGQEAFFGFLANLYHYLYNVAIDERVLNFSVALIFLFLFLSFVVGFIFFVRR